MTFFLFSFFFLIENTSNVSTLNEPEVVVFCVHDDGDVLGHGGVRDREPSSTDVQFDLKSGISQVGVVNETTGRVGTVRVNGVHLIERVLTGKAFVVSIVVVEGGVRPAHFPLDNLTGGLDLPCQDGRVRVHAGGDGKRGVRIEKEKVVCTRVVDEVGGDHAPVEVDQGPVHLIEFLVNFLPRQTRQHGPLKLLSNVLMNHVIDSGGFLGKGNEHGSLVTSRMNDRENQTEFIGTLIDHGGRGGVVNDVVEVSKMQAVSSLLREVNDRQTHVPVVTEGEVQRGQNWIFSGSVGEENLPLSGGLVTITTSPHGVESFCSEGLSNSQVLVLRFDDENILSRVSKFHSTPDCEAQPVGVRDARTQGSNGVSGQVDLQDDVVDQRSAFWQLEVDFLIGKRSQTVLTERVQLEDVHDERSRLLPGARQEETGVVEFLHDGDVYCQEWGRSPSQRCYNLSFGHFKKTRKERGEGDFILFLEIYGLSVLFVPQSVIVDGRHHVGLICHLGSSLVLLRAIK